MEGGLTLRWLVEPNVLGGWDVRPENSGKAAFRSSARADRWREAFPQAWTGPKPQEALPTA